MSGIYIPDMEMPKEHEIIYIFGDGTARKGIHGMRGNLQTSKAIPVPDHGRLIDADALWEKAYKAWGMEYDPWVCGLFMDMISSMPTIIPEDKEDGE